LPGFLAGIRSRLEILYSKKTKNPSNYIKKNRFLKRHKIHTKGTSREQKIHTKGTSREHKRNIKGTQWNTMEHQGNTIEHNGTQWNTMEHKSNIKVTFEVTIEVSIIKYCRLIICNLLDRFNRALLISMSKGFMGVYFFGSI